MSRMMFTLAVITVVVAGWSAPIARADQRITYEVTSADVGMASGIEYFDGTRRILLQNVSLPWRATVQIADPTSLGTEGAEVRASWYTGQLNKFVTVRIYFGDNVRCENTLDLGNAACYGSTPFTTAID